MRVYKTCALIVHLLLMGIVLLAQSNGRFEEAKRMALAYIRSEQFDKAAGRLEEIWEQDQSDPTVGEDLALAYLNTEDKNSLPALQKKAFAIIEELTTKDARVSFIVHHSHEKLAWLQGREWNQFCSGRFSITRNGLAYLADKGKDAEKHSFEVSLDKIKASAIELSEGGVGVFHLKTSEGGYVMSVRNRNREEAKFLVALVKTALSHPGP